MGRRNPCFSKPFNDWEMDYVERFLACLHWKIVCRDAEDTMTTTKSGKFTVNSLYNTLHPDNFESFPMREIWFSWVQPRVSFFLCGRWCEVKY